MKCIGEIGRKTMPEKTLFSDTSLEANRKNTQRYAFFLPKHLDFPKIKLTFVNVSLKSIPNGGYRDNFLRN